MGHYREEEVWAKVFFLIIKRAGYFTLILTAKGKGDVGIVRGGGVLSFSEGYGIYSAMRELALRRRTDD